MGEILEITRSPFEDSFACPYTEYIHILPIKVKGQNLLDLVEVIQFSGKTHNLSVVYTITQSKVPFSFSKLGLHKAKPLINIEQ